MFVKTERVKDAKGNVVKTYFRIVDSYRIGQKTFHRYYGKYQCLENQDPIAYEKWVREVELPRISEEFKTKLHLTIEEKEHTRNSNNNQIYNFGHKFLDGIYDSLKIDKFFDSEFKNRNSFVDKDFQRIFKFLVIQKSLELYSDEISLIQKIKFYGDELSIDSKNIEDNLKDLNKISIDFEEYIKIQVEKITSPESSKLIFELNSCLDGDKSIAEITSKGDAITICFLADILVKLLQYYLNQLGVKLSIVRILNVLNSLQVIKLDNGIVNILPVTNGLGDKTTLVDVNEICDKLEIHIDYQYLREEKFLQELNKMNFIIR